MGAIDGAAMPRSEIPSAITGSVWKIEVAAGAEVAAGETVLLIESMKMEIPVEAPIAGVVTSILVAEGDQVTEGQVLMVIES